MVAVVGDGAPTTLTMPDLRARVEAASASASANAMPVRIVAIDGPGGAGKTTLAARLAAALDGAPIVHTDDFASWDVPLDWWPRLVRQVLEPLADGRPARYQRYDWSMERLTDWVDVPIGRWLVLEGVSASRREFRPFLAYTIWVETPRALRLERGLARDGAHLLDRWQQWMADEDRYVERDRPMEHVDLVVAGDAPSGVALVSEPSDQAVRVVRERRQ